MYYQHTEPVSMQAKIIMLLMRWIGMKKNTERKMRFGLFAKHPVEPSRALRKNFSVRVSELYGRKVWTVSPLHGGSDLVMLYLHGGAYMANLTRQHWDLIGQLIRKTSAALIVPDYPLTPEASFEETHEFIDHLYAAMLIDYPDRRIIFAGDSAGGGLALGFLQHLRNGNKKQPEHAILFSPWLDLSMSNGDLQTLAALDNMLTIRGLKSAAEKYARSTDLKDFRMSPIYGNFEGLCSLSVFTGTNDLLHADSRRLKQQLERQQISFNYFEYPGMFHDWVIITGLEESRDALEKMKGLLIPQLISEPR